MTGILLRTESISVGKFFRDVISDTHREGLKLFWLKAGLQCIFNN